MTRLSIITINLNNASGLEKTITSIKNQTYCYYEYIVIDGGSTDGSLEIIKKYQDEISFWISEPDKGIYNAMNKGILKSSGEYCLFLNSGDTFVNSSVLEDLFSNSFNEDIVYGNLIFVKDGKFESKVFSPNLTFFDFYSSSIGHPSTLIKKKLFKEVGLYNEEYKIVSDWEFFLKAIFINKCSLLHINKEISIFDCNGISSGSINDLIKERENVLNNLFPRFVSDYQKLYKFINTPNLIDASYKTIIHSGNKYIRKFASLINYLLVFKNKGRIIGDKLK